MLPALSIQLTCQLPWRPCRDHLHASPSFQVACAACSPTRAANTTGAVRGMAIAHCKLSPEGRSSLMGHARWVLPVLVALLTWMPISVLADTSAERELTALCRIAPLLLRSLASSAHVIPARLPSSACCRHEAVCGSDVPVVGLLSSTSLPTGSASYLKRLMRL